MNEINFPKFKGCVIKNVQHIPFFSSSRRRIDDGNKNESKHKHQKCNKFDKFEKLPAIRVSPHFLFNPFPVLSWAILMLFKKKKLLLSLHGEEEILQKWSRCRWLTLRNVDTRKSFHFKLTFSTTLHWMMKNNKIEDNNYFLGDGWWISTPWA